MSGQLKEVRLRIKSVKSTQQITKAMKLVSAAKLRRAQDAITRLRPYANKLQAMLSNIAATMEGDLQLPLAEEREVKRVAIVMITSDRGLCGGFNMNIIKAARAQVQAYAHLGAQNIEVFTIGKKGFDVAKKWNCTLSTEHQNLFTHLEFSQVAHIVDQLSARFIAGELDKVVVCYARFRNAAMQFFEAEQFLPIVKPNTEAKSTASYVFEPNQEQLIAELGPKILRTSFYKCILDNLASEHGARMTAMDKASDNANELLKSLNLAYNRARQAAITTELTEIVSGAAALEG